jgi:magnesium-transporting ATPase (P-type)
MVKYFSISFLTYLVSLSITLFIEIGLIYPINWIFNVDMIGIYATVLKLPRGFFSDIFPLFYFLVSIVQTLISFIIISNELPKLNLKQKERKINNIIMYSSLDIVFIILFVIGYFLYLKLCYLALGYMCLCAGVQTTDSFRSNKGVIIIYCIAETIGVFAFVGLLSKLDGKIAFICFIPFLLINMVVSIILSIYFKYNKKIYKPLENDTDSKKRLM